MIDQQQQQQTTFNTLFYTPDFGDLPDFDLPDELELPNIAQVAHKLTMHAAKLFLLFWRGCCRKSHIVYVGAYEAKNIDRS
jgi:hypothetical protein